MVGTVAMCLSLTVCFTLTSCNSPKSDGEKAAKMALELRDVNLRHSYDSDEVQAAAREYDEFATECRRKYESDPKAKSEFEDAFNETIKSGMEPLPDTALPAEQQP